MGFGPGGEPRSARGQKPPKRGERENPRGEKISPLLKPKPPRGGFSSHSNFSPKRKIFFYSFFLSWFFFGVSRFLPLNPGPRRTPGGGGEIAGKTRETPGEKFKKGPPPPVHKNFKGAPR